MRTDTINLKKFKRLSRNPKDHDIGLIMRSIERFGYVEPIVVNETTGRILSGHGRVDALQQRKASGKQVPGNVEQVGDDWLIPVVYVEVAEGDEEAVSIALNRSNELGGWDEGRLVEVLSDLASQGEEALEGTGYNKNDLDTLLANLAWVEPDYDEMWKGMPEFEQENDKSQRCLIVHFASEDDVQDFAHLVNQQITDKTKYIWYPEQVKKTLEDYTIVDES